MKSSTHSVLALVLLLLGVMKDNAQAASDRFPELVVTATAWTRTVEVGNPVYDGMWRPGTETYTKNLAIKTVTELEKMALDTLLSGTSDDAVRRRADEIRPLFVEAYGFDEERAKQFVSNVDAALGQLLARYVTWNVKPDDRLTGPADPLWTLSLRYPDAKSIQDEMAKIKAETPFEYVCGAHVRESAMLLLAVKALGKSQELAVDSRDVDVLQESQKALAMREITQSAAVFMLQKEKAYMVLYRFLLESIEDGSIVVADPSVSEKIEQILAELAATAPVP